MIDAFNKIISRFLGDKHQKDIKGLNPLVQEVNNNFEKLASISNDELREKTNYFKDTIRKGTQSFQDEIDDIKKQLEAEPDMDPDSKEVLYKKIDDLTEKKDDRLEEVLMEILPEAFAVVKETARRFKDNDVISATATELDKTLSIDHPHISINGDQVKFGTSWEAAGNVINWDMVHYDVQLIGGMVLHQGKIAEMATGEGKTLVATLPAYLNGLAGMGVHIVTVNNYLAKRDQEWMSGIFNFLGLTVDCIDKYKPHSEERINAYNADITYGTNNEFGFDYLRDNMTRNPEEQVQRKPHFAMVDEVDSVLVDDARTPLIISGPVERGDQQEFNELKPRIQRLVDAQKKTVQGFLTEAKKSIAEGKTDENSGGLALLRAQRGLPKSKPLIKYLSEPGVKVILQKNENFYMQEQNKNMPLVDKELFFTIEERNNAIDLTEKGLELITKTGEDPQLFVIPDIGSEVAEIEKSDLNDEQKQQKKDQLLNDYAIKSERIHSLQQLLKAYALFEKDVEYVVMDGKVKIVDEQTGRIMEGRRYSDGLHQAIEAKENVKVEAATQTFATITLQNYFRMYHKLAGMTGTAETEAGEFWDIYKLDVVVIPTNRPIQRADNEDLVFRTVREKFNAVVDEIVSLTGEGRPVLVGTTSVETSELLSRMLTMKKIDHNLLNAKQHAREADIVAEAGRPGTVTIATNMAGRGTDIKLTTDTKNSGGLAIIGTERHDSRRVDRQLRGRSGRQGDPGSSQFYVSLEDNLMRLFGSERIAKLMDRMGYEEGEVIQHSMITKSIERAQKKVEENNFGIRKRLLDYDDVMNSQREVIYKRRKHALYGERLSVDLYNSFYDLAEELVEMHQAEGDHAAFKLDVIRYFAIDTAIEPEDLKNKKGADLAGQLYEEVTSFYKRKMNQIMQATRPVIKDVFEKRGETLQNIAIPFTDGKRGMNVVVNLKEAYESEGRAIAKALEKTISLAFIDESWKNHLRQMDELKQSVQSAVYEQKDPLLIYKFEAFELFKGLLAHINREVVSFLYRANLPMPKADEVRAAKRPGKTDMSRMRAGRQDFATQGATAARAAAEGASGRRANQPIKVGPKVGRNAPCPCGSGKKYKQCHGKMG